MSETTFFSSTRGFHVKCSKSQNLDLKKFWTRLKKTASSESEYRLKPSGAEFPKVLPDFSETEE